jgi:membrane protein implicated in regulation of membrane protease activity
MVLQTPGRVVLAIPFLVVFTAGLLAGVYTMLQGVTPGPSAAKTTRIGMVTAPSVAVFAIAFGAVGYLCTTRTSLTYPIVFVIALVAAAATIPASAPVLARIMRTRSAASFHESELEGQLAKVVRPISSSVPGEITYNRDGADFRHRALSLSAGILEPGRDVVIDRIEADVAYVEDWEIVEKRL